MRLIDADRLLEERRLHLYYHLPNGDMAIPIIDIKHAPTVNGWISVNDRLPEEKINPLTQDFQKVICYCDFGGKPKRTDIRTYGFGTRAWESQPHFWHGQVIMDGVITHWMPLPEPPKEASVDG